MKSPAQFFAPQVAALGRLGDLPFLPALGRIVCEVVEGRFHAAD